MGNRTVSEAFERRFGKPIEEFETFQRLWELKPLPSYKTQVMRFCLFTDMNPDELIATRNEDLKKPETDPQKRQFERLGLKFYKHLTEQGYAPASARQALIVVRAFFAHNYVNLKYRRGEVPSLKRKYKDYEMLNGDYLKIAEISKASPRDHALILFGVQSALRIGDILKQKKNDWLPKIGKAFEKDAGEDATFPVGTEYMTEKETIRAFPHIWEDCGQALLSYHKMLEAQGETSDLLFPDMTGYEANRRLKIWFEKAKIKVPKGRRVRFHILRKFSNDRMALCMEDSKRKQLIGKSLGGSDEPYMSSVTAREVYKATRKYLCTTAELTPTPYEMRRWRGTAKQLAETMLGLIEVLEPQHAMDDGFQGWKDKWYKRLEEIAEEAS